jgi:hypothetical protein
VLYENGGGEREFGCGCYHELNTEVGYLGWE